jgi:hypothetical protein
LPEPSTKANRLPQSQHTTTQLLILFVSLHASQAKPLRLSHPHDTLSFFARPLLFGKAFLLASLPFATPNANPQPFRNMGSERRRAAKRPRAEEEEEEAAKVDDVEQQDAASQEKKPCPEPIEMMLYVRWHGPSGQTKVNRLNLRSIQSHDALEVRKRREGTQHGCSRCSALQRAGHTRALASYALGFTTPPCTSCRAAAPARPFLGRLICAFVRLTLRRARRRRRRRTHPSQHNRACRSSSSRARTRSTPRCRAG